MYAFEAGLGVYMNGEQIALRDKIRQVRAKYNGVKPWIYGVVDKGLEQQLNTLLGQQGKRMKAPSTNHSVCAALDYLYNEGPVSQSLKGEYGCSAYYPGSTVYRDYLEARVPQARIVGVPVPAVRLPYCRPKSNACFESYQEQDTAKTQAQFGYKPDRGTDPCPQGKAITYRNIHRFNPEAIKELPLCASPAPVVRPPVPPPEMIEEIEPVDEMMDVVIPGGSTNILDYRDLNWGQGPDEEVAALIREHINPALVRGGYKTISEQSNFNITVCAVIKTQFGDMVLSQFRCPQGIPNPHQFLKKATSGMGAVLPYCSPGIRMCFDYYQERDTAITQCQYGVKPDRGTASCPRQSRITYKVQNMFDPCSLVDFPLCGETAVEARERILAEQASETNSQPILYADEEFYPGSTDIDGNVIPPDESTPGPVLPGAEEPLAPFVAPAVEPDPEPEEDDQGRTMVYGLLVAAVVVGGGVIYFSTRKKKRKR